MKRPKLGRTGYQQGMNEAKEEGKRSKDYLSRLLFLPGLSFPICSMRAIKSGILT